MHEYYRSTRRDLTENIIISSFMRERETDILLFFRIVLSSKKPDVSQHVLLL